MIGILLALPFLSSVEKPKVFVFVLEGCPIARKYAPEIKKIEAEFKPKGVQTTIVHVDPTTDSEDAKAYAKEFGYAPTFLLDPRHRLAKEAGVVNVPTAVVQYRGKYVYVGRIDDRFPDLGVQRPPQRRDLRIALSEVLAGKPVSVPKTKVIGCMLPTL